MEIVLWLMGAALFVWVLINCRDVNEKIAADMSDKQLMDQINYDAEGDRINTAYTREYDKRRGRINGASAGNVSAYEGTPAVESDKL